MAKKPDLVASFVQAFLLADYDRCVTITAGLKASSRERRHCAAIMALWKAQREESRDESALEELRAAQQEPPDDPALMRVLLVAAVRCLVFLDRMSDAQRCVRLLKQLLPPNSPPLVRGWALVAESTALDRLGQLHAAHKLSVRSCELELPPGGNAWHIFRLGLAHTAMNTGNFALAEQAIAELQSRPCTDRLVLDRIAHRRVRLLTLCGRSREGLALLSTLPASPPGRIALRELSYRVRLLLAAGRCTEATAAIDEVADRVRPAFREFLRAKVCLHTGDLAGVREHTRRALTVEKASPIFLVDNAKQLASAELAAGQTRTARSLLRMAEDEGLDPYGAAHWATLCLLEGRREEAARHFRLLLDRQDPILLREALRSAPGLSGTQIAMLWTLAEELEPGQRPLPAPQLPSTRRSGRLPVLVGEVPAMREVRQRVEQYAPLSETVLVTGETGTGKELVARMLHDRSPRAKQPFIAVNCAAISDTLIESELFGHVKGAFTGATQDSEGIFAAAGKGTIFLDEISSMSPRLQAALLRVLENRDIRPVGAARARKVTCRVIAASNQPLEEAIVRKEFRADLYYRLARLHVHLPPLRERREDIPLLVRSFLQGAFEYGEVAIGPDLLAALARHSWPGNVRELRNEIERIVLLAGGQPVLGAGLFSGGEPPTAAPSSGSPGEPPQAAAQAVRPRDRLGRLRELFHERSRLTRAEVTGLLGCSPNTATSYLKALEKEGLIRRVHTSASLRTSYFVPCG